MKKNYNLDMAIIMKKIVDIDGNICFIPYKAVEGLYNGEDKCFYDCDGTPYPHIITNPNSFGYCDRLNINSLMEDFKFMSAKRLKQLRLRFENRYSYLYLDDYHDLGFPVIFTRNYKTGETSNLCDGDIVKFYHDNYENIFFRSISSIGCWRSIFCTC